MKRRDVVYKGVRVFVRAYRDQIAKNRLQLAWDEPLERGERVRLGIEPPYMGQIFDIDASVVFVGSGFVGLELVPLNSRQRYELESHARMCELLKDDFVAAIRDKMRAADGEEVPVRGVVARRSRVPAREDLICLEGEITSVVEFMQIYKLQLNWRELFVRMSQPPPKGAVVQFALSIPHQAHEVELRGKVVEVLGDGARVEVAPYSRETRMRLVRHMHLLEHAAGEVAYEMKQQLGGDAMVALKALLPRATSRPMAPTQTRTGDAADTDPEVPVVATGADPGAAGGSPATAKPTVAAAGPVEEAHSIFRRRRMSRTVALRGGATDRLEPDRPVEEVAAPDKANEQGAPASGPAESVTPAVEPGGPVPAAAGGADFVVPVLLGEVPDVPEPEYAVGVDGKVSHPTPPPAWASAPMPGSFELPAGVDDFDAIEPDSDDPFAEFALSAEEEAEAERLSGDALDAIFGAPTGPSVPATDDWSVPEGAPWLAGDSPAEDEEVDWSVPEGAPWLQEGAGLDDGGGLHEGAGVVEGDARADGGDADAEVEGGGAEPATLSGGPDGGADPESSAASVAEASDEDLDAADPVDMLASRGRPLHGLRPLLDDEHGADGRATGAGPVPARGSLAEHPILAVFATLRARTGILTIKGTVRTATIQILKGRICGVMEEPPDPKRLFGQVLLEMGFHKLAVLNAIDASATSGQRVGDLLLADGTAVPSMLKQAAVTQMKLRIGDLDGFADGTYAFKETVPDIGEGAAQVGALKLLFRGRLDWYIKRPSRQNQMEANQLSDAAVKRTALGRRWVTRLGLALPQQGLWELASTGNYKVGELKSRVSFDALLADATLFTLRDLGCLEFKAKDMAALALEAATRRIDDRFRRKDKTLFKVLDLHWTATDKVVEDAYQRFKRAWDPGRLKGPSDQTVERANEILVRGEEAYATLRSSTTRAVYRESVISEDERRIEARSQAQVAEVALFKADASAAIEALAVSVELFHDPEVEARLEQALTPDGLKQLIHDAQQGEVGHQSSQDRVKLVQSED